MQLNRNLPNPRKPGEYKSPKWSMKLMSSLRTSAGKAPPWINHKALNSATRSDFLMRATAPPSVPRMSARMKVRTGHTSCLRNLLWRVIGISTAILRVSQSGGLTMMRKWPRRRRYNNSTREPHSQKPKQSQLSKVLWSAKEDVFQFFVSLSFGAFSPKLLDYM